MSESFSSKLSVIFRNKLHLEFKKSSYMYLKKVLNELVELEAKLATYQKNMEVTEIRSKQPKTGMINTNLAENLVSEIYESTRKFHNLKVLLRSSYASKAVALHYKNTSDVDLNYLDNKTYTNNLYNISLYEAKRHDAGTIQFYQIKNANISQETYEFRLSRYLQLFYILMASNDIFNDDLEQPTNLLKSQSFDRKTSNIRFTREKIKNIIEQFVDVYPKIFYQYKFAFVKTLPERQKLQPRVRKSISQQRYDN